MKKRIQKRLVEARKNKNHFQAMILRVTLGEFDRISKNPTDEECIKTLNKMIKNAWSLNNDKEALFLTDFVPSLMTKDEVEDAIASLNIPHGSKMADYMKEWKRVYNGQADMKIVSQVVKESYLKL